jgi:Protein of unknown function (DUF1587)
MIFAGNAKGDGRARRLGQSPFALSLLASLMLVAFSARGADDLAQSFSNQIQPLLVKTCGSCHGKVPMDNELDLTSFGSVEVILAKPKLLGDVADRLRLGDMPPQEAPQPSAAEREQLLGWIEAALDAEAAARAGDPGQVTLRRLSNTEYDNAVRDLTGVDMRPTQAREFPVDSVGGEGFRTLSPDRS